MVRDRAKRTKIWDHKGEKTKQNQNFIKKNKNDRLDQNAMTVTVRGRAKRTKILDQKGYKRQITNIFK